MRTGPFVFLVLLAACGPLPVVELDAGLPPIAADAGGTDAGAIDAGPCATVGLNEAELRARCGEPCWTNERDFDPADLWLYDCEGPGGTCVGLDGGVAASVGYCTP